MKFSRPEHWSGQPFPSPGNLPNSGIEPRFPALQVDSLPAEPQGKPRNTGVGSLSLLQPIFPTQESNWGLLNCRCISTLLINVWMNKGASQCLDWLLALLEILDSSMLLLNSPKSRCISNAAGQRGTLKQWLQWEHVQWLSFLHTPIERCASLVHDVCWN